MVRRKFFATSPSHTHNLTPPSQSYSNIGTLGSDAGEKTAKYDGMTVSYSGYEGVDGQPGKEWITITGETSTALEMKAFAFEAGDALVEYEWDRVQTTCCLGTAACTGSFSSSISKGSTVDIGSIPTGKKYLKV